MPLHLDYEEIRKFIRIMLGDPVVKIELTDDQLDAAIKNAFDYVLHACGDELEGKDCHHIAILTREGALIFAKEILGRIRAKYETVPGTKGECKLDGKVLLAEATKALPLWKKEIQKVFKNE